MTNQEPRDLRAEILITAKNLFIQQGYHGLSMRQIAETVGVSKAALYYHFKDKEELFLAILDTYLAEIEIILDQVRAAELSSRQRICLLVESILFQPAEQRAVIRLASQEMAQLDAPVRQAFNRAYHEKFLDKIQAILQAGMDSGELRPLDPEVATWALLGIMYPYFYPDHSGDMSPTAQVVAQVAAVYLDGMCYHHDVAG